MKITDFGVSSGISTHMISHQTNAGTLGFIAPEITYGEKYTTKVDIWSLGKSCVQLATGDPREDLDSKKWSDEFISFVNSCLVKDPEKRPTIDKLKKVCEKMRDWINEWMNEMIE